MIISPKDLLIQTAKSLGIESVDLSQRWSRDAIQFNHRGQQEVVFEGNTLGSTPILAWRISEDLAMLRAYMSDLQLPIPAGRILQLKEEHSDLAELEVALEGFWEAGKTYRCRPAQSEPGYGVASNIQAMQDLELHLDTFGDEFATWIVEAQAEGVDLELLVIHGQIKAAILRRPFSLMGNGESTLEELIDAYNSDATEERAMVIDGATRQLLRDQSVYLTEIVPDGQWVQLKPAETGLGSMKDVTSELHPSYSTWVEQISRAIGLQFFSISLLTTLPNDEPADNATIMRLEAAPNWMAFGSQDVDTNDLAAALLQSLFA